MAGRSKQKLETLRDELSEICGDQAVKVRRRVSIYSLQGLWPVHMPGHGAHKAFLAHGADRGRGYGMEACMTILEALFPLCSLLLQHKQKYADAHSSRPPTQDVPILVGALDDESSLDSITSQTRVLISTTGPFALYGTPVVAAAIRGGCHYVDITGGLKGATRDYTMIARSHIILVNLLI
jgi:hypothetical protein